MAHAAPNLLPGEVRAHPDPWQYVVVAIVLAVITAVEIGVSYLEGTSPTASSSCCCSAMMVVKFFLVASWFMHLRTDQPVFKRLFVVGAIAASVALSRRAGDAARVLATEHRAAAARRRLPDLDAPSRRLAAGRAVRGGLRDRRRPPRTTLVALGPAGGHPLPGDVVAGPELKFKRDTETGVFASPRFHVGEVGARGDADRSRSSVPTSTRSCAAA